MPVRMAYARTPGRGCPGASHAPSGWLAWTASRARWEREGPPADRYTAAQSSWRARRVLQAPRSACAGANWRGHGARVGTFESVGREGEAWVPSLAAARARV